MANTKVSALTAATAVSDDDLLYAIDDPGGTPASKKITVANVATSAPFTSRFQSYPALAVQTGAPANGTPFWYDTDAVATTGGLIALILALGPVSGAHFNPVVSLVTRLFGGLTNKELALYSIVQIVGGCVGAMIANIMFELDAVNWSTKDRSSGALWFSEMIATIGLVVVIFCIVRSGRASAVPYAVGVWIGGAYWFTSSTSFANPAVDFARSMSDTFAGIKPSSIPGFLIAQCVGGVISFFLVNDYSSTPTAPSDRGRIGR
jgi:arsenate reductase